jgi:hypothetical protein
MFNFFIKVFKLKQILKAISQDICFDFEFFYSSVDLKSSNLNKNEFF